ncbi:protein of unknown function [Streptomyces sp. 3213]|uniref:DUF397 domain-containing protein n=1 Tax=Streptomyces sp. 3213.3 TaxID=1855348 RepID=UPI000895BB03|nr:DUF397 domain-containing protein [Streptomyces sp. 3213.3]SED96062.1 protein of unknown function [Streptomyces sp. 3213] [Streptomyces sp. 3213.3]
MELANTQWRKSSYSGTNGGECVEVADRTPHIAIRDSKNPGGAVVTISRRRFEDFINSLSM